MGTPRIPGATGTGTAGVRREGILTRDLLPGVGEVSMRSCKALISTSTRRAMLRGSLGLILAGCGGAPEIQPMPADEQGLKQFAELYRNYTKKNKHGPKSLRELDVKGQGYPSAVEMLKSGRLVVQWGAPLTPEDGATDAVLAYVKTVPEQGGQVLMQDGWTIKTMTADEFKAAPKAGGP